jgi:hypothetical protein
MTLEKKRRYKKQGEYLALAGLILLILSVVIIPSSGLFLIGFFLVGAGAIVIFTNQAKEPRVSESQQVNNDDAHGRDPVLHYEVTKGHFGDSSKQSLTYSGKKTRWR